MLYPCMHLTKRRDSLGNTSLWRPTRHALHSITCMFVFGKHKCGYFIKANASNYFRSCTSFTVLTWLVIYKKKYRLDIFWSKHGIYRIGNSLIVPWDYLDIFFDHREYQDNPLCTSRINRLSAYIRGVKKLTYLFSCQNDKVGDIFCYLYIRIQSKEINSWEARLSSPELHHF